MKRVAKFAFNEGQSLEDLVDASRLAKPMRSDFGSNDRKLTSVGGMSTEIGLSNIDAMVGQCNPSGQAGPSRNPVELAIADMQLLEKLTAEEKFLQLSI